MSALALKVVALPWPSWYRSIENCAANLWGPTRLCTRPILFIMYTADLVSVIEQHGLSPHLYADDTQIYGSYPPSDVGYLVQDISGAWTLLVTGCRAIGFNLMATRLSSCGSLQPDVNSDFPLLV